MYNCHYQLRPVKACRILRRPMADEGRAMEDGLTEGGAMVLIFAGVYVALVFNAGKFAASRGRDELGRQLRTIAISSVMFAMLGGLAGMLVVYAIGDATLYSWSRVGAVIGWAYGVYKGWVDPLKS